MSWFMRLRRYVRDALSGRRLAREIDEELQFHFDTLVEELIERGASPEEARRIALRRFGRMDVKRDEARYSKGVGLVDDLRQDVRYGVRRLRRQPGFMLAVVLTFGLGIGANTAIFSIVDATLLKPLPFRDGDRLVDVQQVVRKGTAEETRYSGISRQLVEDWRAQNSIFDGIETYDNERPVPLRDGTELHAAKVSAGLFQMLGLQPAIGRGFGRTEAGEAGVVIISDGLWRRAFASDPRVLGQPLRLKDRAPIVIGVMPPGTRFPLATSVDAWFLQDSNASPRSIVHLVARLRPGLTPRAAERDLDRVAAAIQKTRPAREPWVVGVETIDPRSWRFGTQPVMLVAFGAVAFVLLTACANVANLLLARASGRQRELDVRRALGASRLRVVRQLLVETSMLVLAGGVVALALAAWLIRIAPIFLPRDLVPFFVHDPALDWRVLAFGAGTTVMVGILSGLLPAWRGGRAAAPHLLSTSAPVAARTQAHRGTRDAFIAAQVAFALVLLTGAGLMLDSFARMVASDPGYDPRNLLSVSVLLPADAYRNRPDQVAFFDRLTDSVRAVPGVRAVTRGQAPTASGGGRFVAEGRERDEESAGSISVMQTGPDYFRMLGIRILLGRAVSDEDHLQGLPVAVVDEDAARRYWPGQSALGKRFRYGLYMPWLTIVGVARNIKTGAAAVHAEDAYEIYLSESQASDRRYGALLVRASGDTAAALRAIAARVRTLEPRAAIVQSGRVEDLYAEMLVNPRFTTLMMALFAALAMLTAAVGVYAMCWYAVSARTSEIGVRIALGARPAQVRRLVFADVLRPVAAGIVIGAVAAQWLTRFIATQLYHVSPHDPATVAVVIAFFTLVALVAALGPARRATRVDPIVALRCE